MKRKGIQIIKQKLIRAQSMVFSLATRWLIVQFSEIVKRFKIHKKRQNYDLFDKVRKREDTSSNFNLITNQ